MSRDDNFRLDKDDLPKKYAVQVEEPDNSDEFEPNRMREVAP